MRQLGTLILIALGMLCSTLPATAKSKKFVEGSKLVVTLQPAGADDRIAGSADFVSHRGGSRFRVRVQNGPSREALEIVVAGISRGTVVTRANGSATALFLNPPGGGSSLALDFDPRGEMILVRHGADDLLTSGTIAGPASSGARQEERAFLSATGVQPAASGHAHLRDRQGVRQFDVEIEDVTDGAYDLLVDGTARGILTTSLGRGEIEFAAGSDDAGKLPLDFEPFGKTIQIARDGAVVLTGSLLAAAPGVSECTPGETSSSFTSSGADPDAHGDARLRVGTDCRRQLRIEIEDLPVGDYDLFADGTLRGAITVASRPLGGTEGEIEFSSDPDDSHELPLDFDPANALFEIRQGGTVFLTTTSGTPGPGVCDLMEVQPNLVNSGAQPAAKGKSRFRQQIDCDRNLRVEVEDLAVGEYELFVAGILRGSFTVLVVGNENVGHIEFDTDPDQPGELLLDFDPRGVIVEVRRFGTDVMLSVTMPHQ